MMVDTISKTHRSWNMSRIRSRDTKPEKAVRSLLHRLGYRFRIYVRRLPGVPDIVMPKYETTIFVHGCYWHRHPGCKYAYNPKSNKAFWRKKFAANIKRHETIGQKLCALGWNVLVVWECETRDLKELGQRLTRELS